jgi:two-component system sensor histidine kinase AgrC
LIALQGVFYVLANTVFAHIVFFYTMRHELRFSLKKTVLIVSLMIAAEQAVPVIQIMSGTPLTELQNFYFLISLLCFIPTTLLVKKEAILSAIFILVVFGTFLDIATLLTEILDQADWIHVSLVFGDSTTFFYQICMIVLSIPFTFLFAKKLLRPVVERTYYLRFWRYLWLIPGYFFLLFRFSVYPKIFKEDFYCNLSSVILVAVWSLGTLVTYCIILAMIYNISQNADANLRLEVAQTQTKMQKEQVLLLQKNMTETRAAKHDLRHHLRVLRGYAEKNDSAQIIDYIDRCFDGLKPLEIESVCDNYELDTILSYYISLARERGIRVTYRVALPCVLPLPVSDVCVVAANLLENAVEASSRQKNGNKFIDIKMGIAGSSMIAIKINNSYDGNTKRKDNLFLSSKHDGMGIGTQSVAHMAEKYNGVLNFEHEGTVFKASVLLSSSDK